MLIGYAETARKVREADRHFIDAKIESIDVKRIFEEVGDFVTSVDGRYQEKFPDGLEFFRGKGRFVENKVVEVNGEKLTAETIVVAVGTHPRSAPFDVEGLWTSDDLFPMKDEVPKSITIVGGGFIACELANFFDAVGVKTRLLVRGESLLEIEDEDIAAIFKKQFTKNVPTSFGTEMSSLEKKADGGYTMQLEGPNGTETHESDRVLFAIGRVPNTKDLGLENTDLEADKRGFLQVDDCLRTQVEGVYATGDVAGRYQLQHVATADVQYLRGRFLKGENEGPVEYGAVPHGVFTDPEVAAVGATEKELKEKGTPYVSVLNDWTSSAKAMSWRLDYPRTKLLVSPDDYRILGCHLIGPDAATVIHQVLAVMKLKNDVREIADMMYVHPALPELLLDAAVQSIKAVREYQKDAQ